jgi:hypothetical protein
MPRLYGSAVLRFAPGAVSIWELIAGANIPVRLKRVELSSDNTSGTVVVRVQVNRISVTGTGTASTPSPVDSNDTAAAATVKVNDTIEPTTGVQVWADEWNLQVPYIWIAGPGEEWRCNPAAGFAIKLLDTPAPANVIPTVSFEED